MEGLTEQTRLLLLLLPLVVIELIGKIAALISVARTPRQEVRAESRVLWVLLIVLVNFAGWIAWFLAGRKRA